jgi:hypothetical protein
MSARGGRIAEAGVVAVLAGALGFLTGWVLDSIFDTSFIAYIAAAIALVNGAISGWRGIYAWRTRQGYTGFVLDSTWSLVMTTAGVFANVWGIAEKDSDYLPDLSERKNVHVYRRGLMPRSGFAITLGNVIGGADEVERESRRLLIEEHEVVHVWQARWLGPIFPILYGSWSLFGALYGVVMWAARHREQPFGKVVETYSYYCNPVEWWAYSRAGKWRPSKMEDGCGWRKSMVRPHAQVAQRSRATE